MSQTPTYECLRAGDMSLIRNIKMFFFIAGFLPGTLRAEPRPAFVRAFIAAGAGTALVFGSPSDTTDVFRMVPPMRLCLLSMIGSCAISMLELLPTGLRSTGKPFCGNIDRFVASSGAFALGLLASEIVAAYPNRCDTRRQYRWCPPSVGIDGPAFRSRSEPSVSSRTQDA
jgi:hypothetical protein